MADVADFTPGLPDWVAALENTPAFGIAPESYNTITYTPGLPDWVAALEGTPAFGGGAAQQQTEVPKYDPNAPDTTPNRPGFVPPNGANAPRAAAGPVPGQSPFPVVPVVPGAQPGTVQQTPPGPGLNGGVLGAAVGGVARRILEGAGNVASAVYDAASAVTQRLTGIVGDVLNKAIPTISELALGIANAASGALSFLADNLTDAADLGLSLANGIAAPFELLLDSAGDMLLAGLTKFIQMIAQALRYVHDIVMRPPALERLI